MGLHGQTTVQTAPAIFLLSGIHHVTLHLITDFCSVSRCCDARASCFARHRDAYNWHNRNDRYNCNHWYDCNNRHRDHDHHDHDHEGTQNCGYYDDHNRRSRPRQEEIMIGE
jgi:hypothetical protein